MRLGGRADHRPTTAAAILDTNLDLLTDIGADRQANDLIMAEIHANRHGVEALDRV